MIELRWYKEKAGEVGGLGEVYHKAVLQYRVVENITEIGLQEPIWSEWREVPTVWDNTTDRREG